MATRTAGVGYVIDTRAGQFTVQALAGGLIAVAAHSPKIAIRDWKGSIQMAASALEGVSLQVRVNAVPLEVLDELRDDDRQEDSPPDEQGSAGNRSVPEVVFDSREAGTEKLKDALYRLRVRGRLTLHGVSNDQDFVAPASFRVDSACAYGTFTPLQSDTTYASHSIAWGSLRRQDELKFSFYAIARRPE